MNGERPRLGEAIRAFDDVYKNIGGTVEAVGRKIGGKVDYNINYMSADQGGFENACAIRISYVLNQAGFKIPRMAGEAVSGKNGDWYIYRVRNLITYLHKQFGPPDYTFVTPTPEKLSAHKGIVVFEVPGWENATGHATVWNGVACSDSCYFNDADKVHVWILED